MAAYWKFENQSHLSRMDVLGQKEIKFKHVLYIISQALVCIFTQTL